MIYTSSQAARPGFGEVCGPNGCLVAPAGFRYMPPMNKYLLVGSVRNSLGARAAPRGNCQEDWTGPDDNFYSVPSWDILGLQG